MNSEGESLYHSGTLGGEATAHWQAERLLAALEGHAFLALNPSPNPNPSPDFNPNPNPIPDPQLVDPEIR